MSAERNCPRKTFKSIRKTVWKTRKKIRKTIRNAIEKCLAPLRPTQNFSPPSFHQILKVFHRPKFAQKKVFFSPRGSAGGATPTKPKGLFRTKNAIAMEIVVFCHRGSIRLLLSVPIRCHFFQEKLQVARLQSEFCPKDFLRATNFLTKNAPKFSPKFLSLYSVGQKKSHKSPPQISHQIPQISLRKIKKKSPTSFCRSAGRRKTASKLLSR